MIFKDFIFCNFLLMFFNCKVDLVLKLKFLGEVGGLFSYIFKGRDFSFVRRRRLVNVNGRNG